MSEIEEMNTSYVGLPRRHPPEHGDCMARIKFLQNRKCNEKVFMIFVVKLKYSVNWMQNFFLSLKLKFYSPQPSGWRPIWLHFRFSSENNGQPGVAFITLKIIFSSVSSGLTLLSTLRHSYLSVQQNIESTSRCLLNNEYEEYERGVLEWSHQ